MLKLPEFRPLSFEERLRRVRINSLMNKILQMYRRGKGVQRTFAGSWNFDDGTSQGWTYVAPSEISSVYYHSAPYSMGIYATVGINRLLYRTDFDFNGQTQSLLDFWFNPRGGYFSIYWRDKDANLFLLETHDWAGVQTFVHVGVYNITAYVDNDVGGQQGISFWCGGGIGFPKMVYVDDILINVTY